jgi:hypothetical protein
VKWKRRAVNKSNAPKNGERAKFFGPDLYEDRDDKNDGEDSCANKVPGALRVGGRFAELRHGYSVAASFAEHCCKDLNDPERKRKLRNFCGNSVEV